MVEVEQVHQSPHQGVGHWWGLGAGPSCRKRQMMKGDLSHLQGQLVEAQLEGPNLGPDQEEGRLEGVEQQPLAGLYEDSDLPPSVQNPPHPPWQERLSLRAQPP